MKKDALDRRAKTRFSRAEKRQYARLMKERDERKSMRDPYVVKKCSDQFRKTIETQLKSIGIKA